MKYPGLMPIGDVARLYHLSVSTLRHYERLGLVAPERIDPETGYRYYSTWQFEPLNTIRYLRALDMPLEEIADLLHDRDVDRIEDKLYRQKQAVADKQRELRRVERKLDDRLRQIRRAQTIPLELVRREVSPPCRMVWVSTALRVQGALDMEGPVRRLERDQGEAVIFLGKVGVGIAPERLNAGHFEEYSGVFLLLDDEDDYRGPVTCLPQTACVSLCFRGSHPQAPEQYRRLMDYIRAEGLRVAGFSREVTLIDYGFTPDPEKFVTEITIPVEEDG